MSTDPASPPSNISLSNVTPMHLMLSWNPSSSSCSSVSYIVYPMDGCYSSAFPHNTAIPKTIITYTNLSTVVKNCSISFQTVLCGNILGEMSNLVVLTLKGNLKFVFALPQ